jgi:rhamnosyltransferase
VVLNNYSTNSDYLVGAVVVLFFPDAKLIERLFSSLSNEVAKIYVIDNTPMEAVAWLSPEWFETKGYSVVYRALGDNYGIAKAQNVAIELAVESGCDHVIFFDQDSAIPKGMVGELLKTEEWLLSNDINVGSVGPIFIDEKSNRYSHFIRHSRFLINRIEVSSENYSLIKTDYLISSGCLIRADVLKKVGLFRENLFIDWLDIEWALRAGRLGFSHYATPTATMLHSIGDGFIKFGKRSVNLHNDVRNYYIVRNACYLLLDSQIDKKWRANILLKIPLWVIFYTLTSKSKLKALKRLLQACFDGFSGRMGRCYEK